jgi:hypothetical protein
LNRSAFKNKKVRISLGVVAIIIGIAVILGAVLGTQLRKTNSPINGELNNFFSINYSFKKK